jgi:hypothetical protein
MLFFLSSSNDGCKYTIILYTKDTCQSKIMLKFRIFANSFNRDKSQKV